MQVVDTFYACGGCSKVFWMGPKSYSALKRVEGLLTKAQPTEQRHVPASFGGCGLDCLSSWLALPGLLFLFAEQVLGATQHGSVGLTIVFHLHYKTFVQS